MKLKRRRNDWRGALELYVYGGIFTLFAVLFLSVLEGVRSGHFLFSWRGLAITVPLAFLWIPIISGVLWSLVQAIAWVRRRILEITHPRQ